MLNLVLPAEFQEALNTVSMSTNWGTGRGRQGNRSDDGRETDRPGVRWRMNSQDQSERLDTDDQAKTIAEGRRIYLGNLLYEVKPNEIEDMLSANGFGEDVESVHISIDPVTGRNPGYCFINFNGSGAAEIALDTLTGSIIRDRPVKVGPCKPKGAERAWKNPNYTPTFQRWGDWRGNRPTGDDGRLPANSEPLQGPYKALQHFQEVKKSCAPRACRVYFGGLGRMINQVEHDKEVRSYLEGFNM
jgi:hypothetical protein